MLIPELKERKVLIVGLGLQGGGTSLTRFCAIQGARVTVTDIKPAEQLAQSITTLKDLNITYRLGGHHVEDFLGADLIFKAPKMRWDHPLIKVSERRGIPIEMETSFFARLCPAPIIGITGTRGKSTTTMMIYEIFKKYSGKTTHLAGNIPEKSSINLLEQIRPNDIVILELSSWQLSGFHRKKISPHIGVFTNLYPDHYDYYKNEEEYFFDKKAIFLYQSDKDFLVANTSLKERIEAEKPHSHIVYFDDETANQQIPLHYLKGNHNKENAAAALQVAQLYNLDTNQCAGALSLFHSLPYRQEIVGEKKGVLFVNDTTSTTPTSTVKAIEAFKEYHIVLLLGGNTKCLPTYELVDCLDTVKKIVLLKGTFTDEIYRLLKAKYGQMLTDQFDDLEKAVQTAYEEAKKLVLTKKVVILFSPGATSFAMFRNEFHRGDQFNQIVKKFL